MTSQSPLPARSHAQPVRRVVGCMSGTSLDGLDVALLEAEGQGLSLRARFLRGHSLPLGELGDRLRSLAEQRPTTAGDVAAMAHDLALLHIKAISAVLGGEKPDLVCVHGQTVFHKPPLSWQLFSAAPVARAVGAPVIFDLRQADLAASGQGAPITPIADWVLFADPGAPGVVLNLGGFANFTEWDASGPSSIRGGDVCACNQLLDALARTRLGQPYDMDGRVASGGTVDASTAAVLIDMLGAQGKGNRSLGTGDEMEACLGVLENLETPTALCTACEAIAQTIVGRVGPSRAVLAAGGGVRNHALFTALRSRVGIRPTDEHGVPAPYREAACFAVLGSLCDDRTPITLQGITGFDGKPFVSGSRVER